MAGPEHIGADQVEVFHKGVYFRVQTAYNLANLDILDPLIRIGRIIKANRDNPLVTQPTEVVGWQDSFSESGALAYPIPEAQVIYTAAYGVNDVSSVTRLQVDKYDGHFRDKKGVARKTGSLFYFDGKLRFTANTLAYPSAPDFEVPVNGVAVRGVLDDIPGLPTIAEEAMSGQDRGEEMFHFLRHLGWRESDPDNPDFAVRVQAHPAALGPIAMAAIKGFTDEILRDLAPLETMGTLATRLTLSPPAVIEQ